LIYFIAWAAITTITSSGNWSNSGIWSGGNIADDISEDVDWNSNIGEVIIQNSESYTTSNMAMNNGNTLTINSGGSLTVGASGNAQNISTGNTVVINVDGNLEIWGDLDIGNDLTISVTGTLIIHGDINIGNGGSLDISGSVSVGGDFNGGNDTMVNVDGNLDVTGNIDTGNGSELTGSGTVSTGSCTGDPDFCSGGPLPIKLAYFNGRAKVNSIELNWTTTSEENFDYFSVQKSINATDFKEIGMVKGAGSGPQSIDYSFEDEKPFSGLNYYRLKAVDLDGTFEYFNVLRIDFDLNRIPVSIYPNPVINRRIIIENYDQHQTVYIDLLNIHGHSLLKSTLGFGKNEIAPTSGLNPGMYILRISYKGQIHTRKVIIN